LTWGEDDRLMLRMDDQVSVYLLALMAKWQNPFLSGYYTVLKKPGTKPNLKREYRIVSKSTGKSLCDESFRLKSDAQKKEKELKGAMDGYDGEIVLNERTETAQEYEERLIADYLARADFYFDRQVVSRTREEIQEMMEKIRTVVSEIGILPPYRSQGIHCTWCEFRDVCLSSRESQELALQYYFQKKEARHEELDGVEILPAHLENIYQQPT
jgi:adenosine deaminase